MQRGELFPFGIGMTDLLRNVLSLNAFTPRYMMKTALEVMLQSADVFKYITPEADRLVWQEFQNKLQAFYLFEYVDSVLGFSSSANLSLEQMIDKTRRLGPFFSVWATEGVGHYYAYLATAGSALPHGLLSNHASHLPSESAVPLHTGMGLALAEALLTRGYDIRTLVETFIQLCQNNSRRPYWRAAVEALGLVVRNLYPHLISPLDHHFSDNDEELLAYFWHGIGRGIYFTPGNFMPYWNPPGQGLEMCLQEAPHELGRRNAVAGFAWAMTLVNIRQPEIIAALLQFNGARLTANDAFANGVFSALVVWLDCAPHDSSVRLLCEYQPDWDPSLLRLWETVVKQACKNAIHYRDANGNADIGEIFRYQPGITAL